MTTPPASRSPHPRARARTRLLAGAAGLALGVAGLLTAPAATAATPLVISDEAGLIAAISTASGGATVTARLAGDVTAHGPLTLDAGALALELAGHRLEIVGSWSELGETGLAVAAGARLIVIGPGEASIRGSVGREGDGGADGPDGADGDDGAGGATGPADAGDGGDGHPGADGGDGTLGDDGGDGDRGGDGVSNSGTVVVVGAGLTAIGGSGGQGGWAGHGGAGGYGGAGGQGGTALADGGYGGTGGQGGFGGEGGHGGGGGYGGTGGEGFVNLGTLVLLRGASLAGTAAGQPGLTGDPGDMGEAGGEGTAGHAGWPVDPVLGMLSGHGGTGGQGGSYGRGGAGGRGGWGGDGGEGLSATGWGVIVADEELDTLLPAGVQTIANARLHAMNGTSQTWWARADGLDEITAASAAAALGGAGFPAYPGHTLRGWTGDPDDDVLLEPDTAFGQQFTHYYARWTADPVTAPALAATGGRAAPPLAAGAGVVLTGLALLLVRLRARRA